MERKNYTEVELNKVLDRLYKKATNRSKAKAISEEVGQTPEEDKCKILTEWDICKNRTYSSYFIKCFYDGKTKAYRYDMPEKELPIWLDMMFSDIPEELESIFDDNLNF